MSLLSSHQKQGCTLLVKNNVEQVMFWSVMFEAASNVGPEGPLKKMPILVLEIPGHTASSHAHTASTQAQQTADSRQPIDDRDSEESDFE